MVFSCKNYTNLNLDVSPLCEFHWSYSWHIECPQVRWAGEQHQQKDWMHKTHLQENSFIYVRSQVKSVSDHHFDNKIHVQVMPDFFKKIISTWKISIHHVLMMNKIWTYLSGKFILPGPHRFLMFWLCNNLHEQAISENQWIDRTTWNFRLTKLLLLLDVSFLNMVHIFIPPCPPMLPDPP